MISSVGRTISQRFDALMAGCSGTLRPGHSKLLEHNWPGNVRELEYPSSGPSSCCGTAVIQAHDIECSADGPNQPFNGSLRAVNTSATMDVERAYLVKTLVTFPGQCDARPKPRARTAKLSGCSGSMELIGKRFQRDDTVQPGDYRHCPSAGRTCLERTRAAVVLPHRPSL